MMTKKQEEILNIITKYIEKNGHSPTVREICKEAGLKSPATVYQHLKLLREKGYLKSDKNKQRTIKPAKEITYSSVPLLGTITAGNPVFAYEYIDEYYPLPTHFGASDELFMLNVTGDSMIDAGINDGDIVIVKKQNDAENHDIVVALIDDSATVKRLVKTEKQVYLLPENPAYFPIYPDTLTVLGKVIGLIRKF